MAENNTPTWDDTTPTWDDTQEVTEVSKAPMQSMELSSKQEEAPKNKESAFASIIPDIGAASMGATQGATFGFADEIGGGASAAYNTLKGEGNYSDLYTKYRDLIREKDKELQERSPITYGVGQIFGTVAPALASGGGSLLTKAGLTGGAKILASAGLGALEGAGAGALYGAGEAPELSDVAHEATEGAKSGALFGGALGGAGATVGELGSSLASKASSYIDDSPRLRQLLKSYEEGTQGIKLGNGTQAKTEMASRKTSDVADLTGKFVSEDKRLGSEIGSLISHADDAGVRIKLDEPLSQSATQITNLIKNDPNIANNPKYNTLVKNIFDLQENSLSPKLAQQTIDDTYELARKLDNPLLTDIAEDFAKGLSSSLDNSVEGLRDAKNNFNLYRSAVPETIINKGALQELPTSTGESIKIPYKKYGEINNKESVLASDIQNFLEEISKPSSTKATADQTINALQTRLNKLEIENPGTVKRFGYDSVDDLITDIRSKGDTESIRQTISKDGGIGSEGELISNLTNMAIGKSTEAANQVGRLTNSPLAEFSKSMYNAPDDAIRAIGTKMTEVPSLKGMGNMLVKALDNKTGISKNAALFSILQNPEARKFLDSNFQGQLDQSTDNK